EGLEAPALRPADRSRQRAAGRIVQIDHAVLGDAEEGHAPPPGDAERRLHFEAIDPRLGAAGKEDEEGSGSERQGPGQRGAGPAAAAARPRRGAAASRAASARKASSWSCRDSRPSFSMLLLSRVGPVPRPGRPGVATML